MRPATIITLAIMLVGFAVLSWMANSSLGLVRHDLEAQQQLSARFGDRGQLAPGMPIRLRRVSKGKDSEQPGAGLLLELTPSAQVLGEAGRLERLVVQAAAEALQAYPGENSATLVWVRARVHLPGSQDRLALLEVAEDGRLRRPKPALPSTWPERPAPPVPPAAPVLPVPSEAPGPQVPERVVPR